MSSADDNFITLLNVTLIQFTRYYSIVVLLFGTIGNLTNIVVLSHSSIRSNSCIRLLFLASVANLLSIWSGLMPRMLSVWDIDLVNTVSWLCKGRTFLFFSCENIGYWLVTLAGVDRWLHSSNNVNWRQLGSLRNANIGASVIATVTILLYGSAFYCYEANLTNAPFKCFSIPGFCRVFNNILYTVLIVLSIILTLIFSSMTYFNIRRNKARVNQINVIKVQPSSSTTQITQKYKQKTDSHVRMMLFGQSSIMIIIILPFIIQRLYLTFTTEREKSAATKAVENFIFTILALSIFITQGVSFYIYILCGGVIFRNALKKSALSAIQFMKCRFCVRVD